MKEKRVFSQESQIKEIIGIAERQIGRLKKLDPEGAFYNYQAEGFTNGGVLRYHEKNLVKMQKQLKEVQRERKP